MRASLDLDDELMAEAMRRTGLTTEKAVVDEALRTLVQLERQKDLLGLEGIWKDDPEAAAIARSEDKATPVPPGDARR